MRFAFPPSFPLSDSVSLSLRREHKSVAVALLLYTYDSLCSRCCVTRRLCSYLRTFVSMYVASADLVEGAASTSAGSVEAASESAKNTGLLCMPCDYVNM